MIISSADPTQALFQYGALGIMLVIVLGFTWYLFKLQVKRTEESESENKEWRIMMRDQISPVLKKAVDALEKFSDKALPELEGAKRDREDMKQVIQAAQRAIEDVTRELQVVWRRGDR